MKLHFIAIGGSAMHNLAIALHKAGHNIVGSDDEIFEPSKSRLAKYGLLPRSEGWDENKITLDLDAIILGMHARADNPELRKANELGIPVYSYPEYLYQHSKTKKRIVIGGSHGKTTITAMILHVMKERAIDCDYMVGAQLEGFEVMVKLSDDAKYIILEGDEYLTSPEDRRPKFHLYHPDIALLSGIAWDHINVFPTFENYVDQFRIFIDKITLDGTLIYCTDDEELRKICPEGRNDIKKVPYSVPDYRIENGRTIIRHGDSDYPLMIFGRHNLLNLNGAMKVCRELNISEKDFLTAIQSFKGASKRLELVTVKNGTSVYKDFAHSPSKLSATIKAVKEQYPEKKLVACMELHTFSSLSREFLSHYKGCMDAADFPIVYFSPHALQLKKLPMLSEKDIREGFGNDRLEVFSDSVKLQKRLKEENWNGKDLLLMSSGNFDGIEPGRVIE